MNYFDEVKKKKNRLFLFLGKSPSGEHDLNRISALFPEDKHLSMRREGVFNFFLKMFKYKTFDEVIFIHSSPYNAILSIILACKKKFLIVHNPKEQVSRRGVLGFIDQVILRTSLNLFSNFIFISEHVAKSYNYKDSFILSKTLMVRKPLRENLSNTGILFFGRYLPYKNVEWVVELSKHIDEHVTIVSEGFELKETDLINNLTVINDWFPEEKVSELFLSNKTLVLPYSEVSQSGPFWLGLEHSNTIIVPDLQWFQDYNGIGDIRYFKSGCASDFISTVKKTLNEIKC